MSDLSKHSTATIKRRLKAWESIVGTNQYLAASAPAVIKSLKRTLANRKATRTKGGE